MDNKITLILILIALWSIFSKIKAKQKTKRGATPPSGGWVSKLNAFLADLKNKIEQQAKESTTSASGWDQFLDDGAEYSSQADVDEAALDDLVFEEAEAPPRPEKMPPAVPARAQATRADKTQFVPGVPRRKALHAGQPPFTSMAVSRAELRKAVIWSEILGPPVALKDQRGGRR